jgi:mannose-6-phosphate isomerase-like protein (cupin superfamily)
MIYDDLASFKDWWINNRVLNTPTILETNFNGSLSGVVLFRDGCYQVQLFIVKPDSVIEPHIHPNVDSFEVFIGGDIRFMCNDEWFEQNTIGDSIRVYPNSWHGGEFGGKGGCFLSIQKWLNGVSPTSVGDDWHDKNNNVIGTATEI